MTSTYIHAHETHPKNGDLQFRPSIFAKNSLHLPKVVKYDMIELTLTSDPTSIRVKKMSIIPNSNPFEDSPFSTSIQELSRENPAFINSQIDWKETPEGHVLKADVAGLRKEEVKVEVEDGRVLQIRGERMVEREDNSDAFHRVECSSGKFMRSFTLPANAKLDQVKASLENGVLTVTVPKEEVKNSY